MTATKLQISKVRSKNKANERLKNLKEPQTGTLKIGTTTVTSAYDFSIQNLEPKIAITYLP